MSADIFNGLIIVVEGSEGCGRDVVFLHQLLGEVLAGLDAGGSGGRAEYPKACLRESIRDSSRKRNFRADHGQVNAMLLGELHEFWNLSLLKRNALGLNCNPGVTGCAIDLADTSGTAQGIHNSMLASASPDNQHILGQQSVQHDSLAVTLVR